MKSIVAVLLSVIVAIEGAAIESQIADRTELFPSAWNTHDELKSLQGDINEQLTEIHTSVSAVLRSSTNDSLSKIENNANSFLEYDEPARRAIFALEQSACVNNLKVLLNGVTEFSGFGSSNCVTRYNSNVQTALNVASEAIGHYEESFGDVQQIVVQAFIGRNLFIEADNIETTFRSRYEAVAAQWNAARPNVESFASNLSVEISSLNDQLGQCFEKLQSEYPPVYGLINGEIATCTAFDNTADPFAAYRR